jgi:hypothetical protein
LFDNARAALVTLRKTFETWIVIGKAVAAARARADRIGGGKTFRRILEQQGLGELPPATATRLEQVVARLDEVTVWHSGLPGNRQIAWASPSAVFKHCPVFAKERTAARPDMKPRRPKANVEAAIDIIVDYGRELAEDARIAIVTRIADGLGIATKKACQPKPKATGKKDAALKQVFQQAQDTLNATLGNLMKGN